jgi:hypothetical protein
LEAEFNEAELLPKTKEAAIMAAAAYIAANASNGDEHMWTFKTWRSRASGCSKARMSKDTTQHHEETFL